MNAPLETPAAVARAPLLSVVVPVFNEAEVVDLFLARLAPALAAARDALGPGGRTEIVFVDDGSLDGTAERIAAHIRPGAGIALVRLSRNFGKDSALAAGLAHARGDAVLPMDVDLQDPPELIVDMIAAWRRGAKVVNAVRSDRRSDGWFKRSSARLFYRLYNRLSSYPIADDVGDFRLLDRSAVAVLNQMPERIRFMKGLFAWIGFRQATISYERPARAGGTSKWRGWQLWNFALDGITGSTTLPLRIWTYLGLTIAVGALLYAGFIVVRTLLAGVDVPGYASLLTVILTLGALNLIALGIIGEYVGRIAVEVRARPLYVVEEIVDADDPALATVARVG
jgi:glycosyltransferase involved in cell wall biosynthesis